MNEAQELQQLKDNCNIIICNEDKIAPLKGEAMAQL